MKMYFKQRMFSWTDCYDIYDEDGNVLFEVKGKFDFTHNLEIYNNRGQYLARIKQKFLTWLPQFEIFLDDECVGKIQKEFSFFHPRYDIDVCGWHIEGDAFGWDYSIVDASNQVVAIISKELFHWTDTYIIETDQQYALMVLLVVLAIDCDKCSSNNNG